MEKPFNKLCSGFLKQGGMRTWSRAAVSALLTEILDNSQALDLANGHARHGQMDWPAVPLGGLHIRTCKAPAQKQKVTSTCYALKVRERRIHGQTAVARPCEVSACGL